MQKEIWKDVQGYNGIYQISNLGNVKSIAFGYEKILTPTIQNGYYRINFYTKQKAKPFYIHRLIALAFIPNPENKPEINHKNGIKTDNRIENLEWVTHYENIRHSIEVLGHKMTEETKEKLRISNTGKKRSEQTRKRISESSAMKRNVFCIETGKVWDSIKKCADDTGISYRRLRKQLRLKTNKTSIRYEQ